MSSNINERGRGSNIDERGRRGKASESGGGGEEDSLERGHCGGDVQKGVWGLVEQKLLEGEGGSSTRVNGKLMDKTPSQVIISVPKKHDLICRNTRESQK